MTQSKPPALATWMLEHLLWGGRNEALAGDLLEEFRRLGSVAWYWRQVFRAILASFSSEVRADWVMVWTIIFIPVWAYGLYLYLLFMAVANMPIGFPSRLAGFLITLGYSGKGMQFVVFHVLPFLSEVVVPLVIYLAVARNLNLRAVVRGTCAAMAVTIGFHFLPFHVIVDFLVLHSSPVHSVQVFLWFLIVPGIVPLLAGMWAAQSGKKASPPAERMKFHRVRLEQG